MMNPGINSEKSLERLKIWRQANPEKASKRGKTYYDKHNTWQDRRRRSWHTNIGLWSKDAVNSYLFWSYKEKLS